MRAATLVLAPSLAGGTASSDVDALKACGISLGTAQATLSG